VAAEPRPELNRGKALLLTGAGFALTLGLLNLAARACSAPPPAPAALGLRSADVAKVRAAAYLLSTRPGARVSAVRARGSAVWARFFPEVTGPDVDAVRSHDLLVVRSTDSVPQDLRRTRAGDPYVATAVVSVVIDATTGRVVEITTAPADRLGADDNAVFGAPAPVILTDVAPPRG
jgi:hypothetical protein